MLVYWPHYVSSCPEQVTLWSPVHLLSPVSPASGIRHTVKGFHDKLEAPHLNCCHLASMCPSTIATQAK